MPKLLLAVLLTALLLITSVHAEPELHRLGAIRSEMPDWIQPSPFIDLEPGRELEDFVDNSAGLPPVGNQGSQGSCTAWACAYYYLTYTQGQEYGWDLTDPAHQMSAAFTYNLINGGADHGSNPFAAFEVFETLGSATVADMPYNQSIYNAFPSETAFRNGIQFRTETTYSIDTYSWNGIQSLKNHIANGNIAMIAMTVWPNFDNISQFDYNYCVNDIYGEVRGGHAVTVIGYDDDRVTSDGVGAFKMVNSWGSGWGMDGFWWMSYEAFMSDMICWGYALYADDKIGHEAELVATIELAHTDRYALSFDVGYGTSDSPEMFETYFDFSDQSNLSYPENTRIVIDLTDCFDLVDADSPNDFYVTIDDRSSYDGRSGEIQSVTVEDISNGHIGTCLDMPVDIPDDWQNAEVDVVFYYAAVPPDALSADLDLADGNVTLNWPAVTGGNDFIGYNIYREGQMIATTDATSYVDVLPEFGEYEYFVTSVWEPCQSWPSPMDDVNFITPVAASYEEITELNGATGDFTLNWEQLRPYQIVLDDGTSEQPMYFNQNAAPGSMFAQKFVVEGDGKLLRISCYFEDQNLPYDPVSYRVLEDQDGVPGAELITTPLFTPTPGHWKNIYLGYQRVPVQAGQEIWIAVVYPTTGGSPIGYDLNGTVPATKMMIPDGQNWIPVQGNASLMIRGHFGEEELVGGWTGLLGFDVYQDDELVAQYTDDTHEYSDALPGAGDYDFRVDAVYQQGVWTGETMTFSWDGFTHADESLAALPDEFNVSPAYPNPFNPSTAVQVHLPRASELQVTVHNTLGQQVGILANDQFSAGDHRIVFDATGLASGVYFVHVKAGRELNQMMKVLYLR